MFSAGKKEMMMNNRVYKTEKGRKIVESKYQNLLTEHSVLNFKQLFIPTEFAQTHVLRFGSPSNPPLVMIHGTASNSAAWLGNVSDFIDHFCIYCVDIPGEPGLSEPVRFTLASEEPYIWLNSLIEQLGIKRASFITISLGSWFILNYAVHCPERIKAMSILTTGGIVPAKKYFIAKAIFYMMLGKPGQKMLNRLIFHKTQVPAKVLEFQETISKHFLPVLEAIPIFNDEQLANITAPVQYFGGDHDALIDSVKTGQRLERALPHSEINILKDTGHVIIDQFAKIKKFMVSH